MLRRWILPSEKLQIHSRNPRRTSIFSMYALDWAKESMSMLSNAFSAQNPCQEAIQISNPCLKNLYKLQCGFPFRTMGCGLICKFQCRIGLGIHMDFLLFTLFLLWISQQVRFK